METQDQTRREYSSDESWEMFLVFTSDDIPTVALLLSTVHRNRNGVI